MNFVFSLNNMSNFSFTTRALFFSSLVVDTVFCTCHIFKFINIRLADTSEISIQGKRDGTTCAVVNQQWTRLILTNKILFSVTRQPILQLIDNSFPFPCCCNCCPYRLALVSNWIENIVSILRKMMHRH